MLVFALWHNLQLQPSKIHVKDLESKLAIKHLLGVQFVSTESPRRAEGQAQEVVVVYSYNKVLANWPEHIDQPESFNNSAVKFN